MNTVETFEFVCICCNLLVEQNTLSCHLTSDIDFHLLVGLLQNGMFSKVRFYYGKQDTSHVPFTYLRQVGTPFLVLTKREVNRGGQSVFTISVLNKIAYRHNIIPSYNICNVYCRFVSYTGNLLW